MEPAGPSSAGRPGHPDAGKSAVYFVATALLRAAGRGPDGDRLAPAGAHAQPGRRRRARRHPRRDHQLQQHREWAEVYARGGRGRSTCCWSARSGSTTPTSATTCCPSWPRRPGSWSSTRPTASPTGATTSGPTTAHPHAARRAAPGHAGAGDDRHRQRARRRRRRRATGSARRWCCAGRSTASRCACRSCDCPTPRTGWPGWPSTSTSCPAPASSTRSPWPRPTRSPPSCASGARGGRLLGPHRGAERLSRRGGPARQPDQGAGRDVGARHGLRQAGPRLRRPPRRAAVADRLLPAGRPGRPAVERAEVLLLPGPEDEAIWRYFASLAFPPEDRWCASRRLLEQRPADVHAGAGDARRPEPHRLEMMLKVLDVDGAVRRVQGRLGGTGRTWTYDAERYARVREGGPRAAGDAPLRRRSGRLPDGVPARYDASVDEAAAEDTRARLMRPNRSRRANSGRRD